MKEDHFLHSSLRESILEHTFIGEILRTLWEHGHRNIEVLKAGVDNCGYDLVITVDNVSRYIQLKASVSKGQTSSQKTNKRLIDKENPCVVWMVIEAGTLKLRNFLWFENFAELSSFSLAKHTKGNKLGVKATRPNIYKINKGKFIKVDTIETLIRLMFPNL